MRSRCRCSMCPAIHTNSRSWLRSSSTHEPSDPPLRVIFFLPEEEVFSTHNVQATDERAKSPGPEFPPSSVVDSTVSKFWFFHPCNETGETCRGGKCGSPI